jgi:hypothetical protein
MQISEEIKRENEEMNIVSISSSSMYDVVDQLCSFPNICTKSKLKVWLGIVSLYLCKDLGYL